MAARVLKPLVRAIDTAHTSVIDTAARIGWQGVQLQPLESLSSKWHNVGTVMLNRLPVTAYQTHDYLCQCNA